MTQVLFVPRWQWRRHFRCFLHGRGYRQLRWFSDRVPLNPKKPLVRSSRLRKHWKSPLSAVTPGTEGARLLCAAWSFVLPHHTSEAPFRFPFSQSLKTQQEQSIICGNDVIITAHRLQEMGRGLSKHYVSISSLNLRGSNSDMKAEHGLESNDVKVFDTVN